MKALEIYANLAWSMEAPDDATLLMLAEAAALSDEVQRKSAMDQIRDGTAYCFVGDPVTLDFSTNVFDKITVHYRPSVLKSLQIQEKARRWLKDGGTVKIPEEKHTIRIEEPFEPLTEKIFRFGLKHG